MRQANDGRTEVRLLWSGASLRRGIRSQLIGGEWERPAREQAAVMSNAMLLLSHARMLKDSVFLATPALLFCDCDRQAACRRTGEVATHLSGLAMPSVDADQPESPTPRSAGRTRCVSAKR